jgi:S-adenosylmethionine hydrolase
LFWHIGGATVDKTIMSPRVIALTTDFGHGSHYVAQMKGVLLGLNPEVRLVDVTHDIAPQNLQQAAFLLEQSAPVFPPDTCHVIVVDPGVGSRRRILLARLLQQYFIAPDNGVLGPLLRRSPLEWVLELTASQYWREPVSRTFHGRDIMAPVAGHLSLGVEPSNLGRPVNDLVNPAWPAVRVGCQQLTGSVVLLDAFGNVITNIHADLLASIPTTAHVRVRLGTHEVEGLVGTYAERDPGTLVALVGSGGHLELATVNGNAAAVLRAEVGDAVSVSW